MRNPFAQAWAPHQNADPGHLRRIRELRWDEFAYNVWTGGDALAQQYVDDIAAGDIYVLQRAIDPQWADAAVRDTRAWAADAPPSFHQMTERCPNFHRIIDADATKSYSVEAVRHGWYVFPWNNPWEGTPELRPAIAVWRTLKLFNGLDPEAFETNTPKDGTVDRMLFYQYPPGGGRLDAHTDPTNHHPIFMTAMLSTRGRDFTSGGLFAIGPDGTAVDLEDKLRCGDLVIGHAKVKHGVAPIDPDAPLDWSHPGGRWSLGLCSVDSDHVAERVTAQRAA